MAKTIHTIHYITTHYDTNSNRFPRAIRPPNGSNGTGRTEIKKHDSIGYKSMYYIHKNNPKP